MGYTKHYIPLECNPDLFTQLIPILNFQDVFSLDPDMRAFLPHPVLALILGFPTSDGYEKEKTVEEKAREDCVGRESSSYHSHKVKRDSEAVVAASNINPVQPRRIPTVPPGPYDPSDFNIAQTYTLT